MNRESISSPQTIPSRMDKYNKAMHNTPLHKRQPEFIKTEIDYNIFK